MNERQDYYMKLLEGRAKRLNELLEISAPLDMICKEVMLLVNAAQPLQPTAFKQWGRPMAGGYLPVKEKQDEEQPAERYRVVTG